MATAITALYGMGYTLADDESIHGEMMDEDRGSEKSSPDIHRHRQLAGAFDPAHQLFSPATSVLHAPVPSGSQYAAMLAGIGLNLTAVRPAKLETSACIYFSVVWLCTSFCPARLHVNSQAHQSRVVCPPCPLLPLQENLLHQF